MMHITLRLLFGELSRALQAIRDHQQTMACFAPFASFPALARAAASKCEAACETTARLSQR